MSDFNKTPPSPRMCHFSRGELSQTQRIHDEGSRKLSFCQRKNCKMTSFRKRKKVGPKSFRYLKWRDSEPYVRPFWGWVFPSTSHIHTAYTGEYLHFRYLKCLVISVITTPKNGLKKNTHTNKKKKCSNN